MKESEPVAEKASQEDSKTDGENTQNTNSKIHQSDLNSDPLLFGLAERLNQSSSDGSTSENQEMSFTSSAETMENLEQSNRNTTKMKMK